jgi:mRNA-degrading endonuclease RelE of RelBE toxin-antitoxin system
VSKPLSGSILLASQAFESLQQLRQDDKRQLTKLLRRVVDDPEAFRHHKLAFPVDIEGKRYSTISAGKNYRIIYRVLTSEELEHQGRDPSAGGILIIDVVPSDSPL